jgi:rhodanese-related sulfurtransferase
MSTLSAGERGLMQQGYDYGPQELKTLQWGLRFTPSVCMLGAAVGLYLQAPQLHFALAALGILPFWFPARHPTDLVYNKIVRHLWGGVALPPNPLPRRIACLMGGVMNILIGLSFFYGNPTLAYVFGGVLLTLQVVVISTHFCLASWMWEGLMRIFGRWEEPSSVDELKALVAAGATLMDVRDPDEYQRGHLDGAVNVPSFQVEQRAAEFKDQTVVLYCQSGLRSQDAAQTLKKQGCDAVFNLGAMRRWQV